MSLIFGYIIHILSCSVIIFSVFGNIFSYINDATSDEILKINILFLFAISVLHAILIEINKKRTFDLIPKQDISFQLTAKTVNLLAWKLQLNYLSIASVLIGLINLTLFLITPYQHEIYLLIIGLLVFVPLLNFFSDKRELSKYLFNVSVDVKIIGGIYYFKAGNKTLTFKRKDLRYIKKTNRYILVRNLKNNESLIFPINDN